MLKANKSEDLQLKDLMDLDKRVYELVSKLREKSSEISACVSFLNVLRQDYGKELKNTGKVLPEYKNAVKAYSKQQKSLRQETAIESSVKDSYKPNFEALRDIHKLRKFLMALGYGCVFIQFIINADEIPIEKRISTDKDDDDKKDAAEKDIKEEFNAVSFNWLLRNHEVLWVKLVEEKLPGESSEEFCSFSSFMKVCFNYDSFDKNKLFAEIKRAYEAFQEKEKTTSYAVDEKVAFGVSKERKRNAIDILSSLNIPGFTYFTQIVNLLENINQKLQSIKLECVEKSVSLNPGIEQLAKNMDAICKELRSRQELYNDFAKEKESSYNKFWRLLGQKDEINTVRIVKGMGGRRKLDLFGLTKNEMKQESQGANVKKEEKIEDQVKSEEITTSPRIREENIRKLKEMGDHKMMLASRDAPKATKLPEVKVTTEERSKETKVVNDDESASPNNDSQSEIIREKKDRRRRWQAGEVEDARKIRVTTNFGKIGQNESTAESQPTMPTKNTPVKKTSVTECQVALHPKLKPKPKRPPTSISSTVANLGMNPNGKSW